MIGRIHWKTTFFFGRLFLLLLLGFGLGCTESTTKYFPDQGPHLRSITLEPNYISLIPGAVRQLTVILRDADSNLVAGKSIQWFVGSPEVAQVSESGVVTAGANRGRTYIQASVEGLFSNPVAVNVTLPPTSLSVAPDSAFLLVSGSIRISWDIRDSTNALVSILPSFTSRDTAVALIDQTGIVTGRATGETKILVSVGSLNDSVAVSVYSRYDSLHVSPAEMSLTVGEHGLFSSIAYIGHSPYYPTGVQWRVLNGSIASISSSGTVTALDSGTTEVVAAIGNVVSRASRLVVTRANISTDYLLIGTDNTITQVSVESRSTLAHTIPQLGTIQQIRRSPDGQYAMVSSSNQNVYLIDLANYSVVASTSEWITDNQPLAWSPDGSRVLGMSRDSVLWQWHFNAPTATPTPLRESVSGVTYLWSHAATIADTIWLVTAERNQQPYYHYAIGFSGITLDSIAFDQSSFGTIRDYSENSAWEITSDRFRQIYWDDGVNRLQFGSAEYPRSNLRSILAVARDGTVALALTNENTVARFAIPPLTTEVVVRGASDFSHFAVYGNPLEVYGSSSTERVFRIRGLEEPDYRWYESPHQVLALDR
ncbi:MAG: Ig-like domain-containing protein [bacterium]|nr:Ig-like domain-containing protein [bacterium]